MIRRVKQSIMIEIRSTLCYDWFKGGGYPLINERLVAIRTQLGMSQRAFCKRLNLTQSTYAPFETGRCPMRDIYISLICRVYSVNETWFRTGEGEMFTDKSDSSLNELLEIYDGLTPSLKRFLLNQARELQELQGEM